MRLRSLLFVPADRPERFAKAGVLQLDGAMIDAPHPKQAPALRARAGEAG